RLGYKKLITTPHVSENYYPNSIDYLKGNFNELVHAVNKEQIPIDLQLGAEYMVDGKLLHSLKNKEELLSWNGHILIETSFQSLPLFVDEVLFEIQSTGLIPVLAHPERYAYFFGKEDKLIDLRNRGVKMQITAGSLAGYYGKEEKKMAQKLLNKGGVDFIGSDVHGARHIEYLEKGLRSKHLKKRAKGEFLNQGLLS
ncbi:MAG: CpsB/CapC family capsule biosynthesis tyrosine phosphatase, partial [Cyclobacteriaceae bacterium]